MVSQWEGRGLGAGCCSGWGEAGKPQAGWGSPTLWYLSRGSSPREGAGCLHSLLILLPASAAAPQPLTHPLELMPLNGQKTVPDGLAGCRVPQ